MDAVHAGGGVQASHFSFPKPVFGYLKKKGFWYDPINFSFNYIYLQINIDNNWCKISQEAFINGTFHH